MQLSDFNFKLPSERIARYPVSRRSESRLLCVGKTPGELSHSTFHHVVNLINEGDLLVSNY
jgi:S-adenosylmethionine:tRNA ribosyltransferase-isomerase